MRLLIFISFVVALILSTFPLPYEWRVWRPEFVALLVVYWTMHCPEYFGILMGWLCGLAYDIVELAPLGYNSLGLLIIAYISHLSYQRIRNYAVWQQAVWTFVLVGIYQLFCHWVNSFMQRSIEFTDFLYATTITAFLWPLLVVMIRAIKTYFRIT